VRLLVRSGPRLIATGSATIRGNRTTTVTLTLSRSFVSALAAGHHRQLHTVRLSVLSSWKGSFTAVAARTWVR
jgi:hypothetical protein